MSGPQGLSYVYRTDLLEPHTVPWTWSQWEMVNPMLNKPRFARLVDGRWMQVVQAEGEVISGHVMSWEEFSLLMNNQRRNRADTATMRNTCIVVACICAAVAFHGQSNYSGGNGLVGLIEMVIGGVGCFGSMREALKHALQLRRFVVMNPGPNVLMRPAQQIVDQAPYGGPATLDAHDAQGALQNPKQGNTSYGFPWQSGNGPRRLGRR